VRSKGRITGYTIEVFQEAQAYAEHAGHEELTLEDVRLAIQAKVTHSFTSPPSREVRLRPAWSHSW